MKRSTLIFLLGSTWLASACSSEGGIGGITGLGGRHKDSGAGETKDGDVDEDGENSGKKKYTRSIDNSGAGFQVKDVALLRSSVESCMGSPDMLKVTGNMLRGESGSDADAEGHVRFLLPTVYAEGDDVLEVEKSNMVDSSTGVRAGIAADSLTDTYLRSLETVANVVAHNCTADKEECKCQSKDLARKMLERCLPGLDPETVEMDAAAEMLGLVCAEEEGPIGMRKAIASLLSSYAFASAR